MPRSTSVVEHDQMQLPSALDNNHLRDVASNFGISRGHQKSQNASLDSDFLPSLEAFRAIAIVCVVAGHAIGSTGWVIDSPIEKFIANNPGVNV